MFWLFFTQIHFRSIRGLIIPPLLYKALQASFEHRVFLTLARSHFQTEAAQT